MIRGALVSLHILALLFFSSVNTGLIDGGEGGGTKAASRGISGSASTTPNIKRTTKEREGTLEMLIRRIQGDETKSPVVYLDVIVVSCVMF